MIEQTINKTYIDITAFIMSRQIKRAINSLNELLNNRPNWEIQNLLEQVSTSYDYMLQYMLEETPDPNRHEVYNDITIKLLNANDLLHHLLLDSISHSLFHVLRNQKNNYNLYKIQDLIKQLESINLDISVNTLFTKENTQDETTTQQKYDIEKRLFLATWTNIAWSREDEDAANYLLQPTVIQLQDICLFISAVTLSLFQCFDIAKFIWLFKAYMQLETSNARQRAIIGIFFTQQLYADRLSFYPSINKHLQTLEDNSDFSRDLLQCYINFIYCRETGKITEMMNKEIVPGIIKSMNKPSSIKEEDDEAAMKWMQPHFEDKKLEAKLERLTQMSIEGGDLYMSTFQHLKNFTFFQDIENWFKPFDINQPAIKKLVRTIPENDISTIFKVIDKALYMCDNDKYSLIHLLPQMPTGQFGLIKSQFEDAEEMMQEEKGEIISDDDKTSKLENGNYMHNLYRFYKLSARKKEFTDIFNIEINFQNTEINNILFHANSLRLLAEFLFKKRYWREAGHLYEILISLNKNKQDNGNLFSHLGYIYQKVGMYQEAATNYMKAEALTPNDIWLKEQIALCLEANEKYDDALLYYKEIESIHPEDIKILYHIATCLAYQEKYDDAFKYFFKIDYIDPNNTKNKRAIAWYSFIINKYNDSEKYYNQIIATSPVFNDYLNLGHVTWCKGNLKEAVKYYKKAFELCKDENEFRIIFESDSNELIKKGIDKNMIPLIMDIITN